MALLGMSAMSLLGCTGSLQPRPVPASYDLAQLTTSTAASGDALPLRRFATVLPLVDLKSPPWLNTTAMQYRLAYSTAEAQRRYSFAQSRWVATPADMLRQVLKQAGQVQDVELAGSHCQLQMELDEFIQVFDSEQQSTAWLVLRLNLLSHHEPRVVAHQVLRLSTPAGSDAASGVAAFAKLSQDLGGALDAWRVQLVQTNPAVREQCREHFGN